MRLADFILQNMEPILQHWEDFAKTLTPAASDPASVPTLGEWALWLMSALLGGFALMGMRRQRQQG